MRFYRPLPACALAVPFRTCRRLWAPGAEAPARVKETAPIPIAVSDSSDDSDHRILGLALPTDGVRRRRQHCQQPRASARAAGGTRKPAKPAPKYAHPGTHQVRRLRRPPANQRKWRGGSPTQVPGAAVPRGSTARGEPATNAIGQISMLEVARNMAPPSGASQGSKAGNSHSQSSGGVAYCAAWRSDRHRP